MGIRRTSIEELIGSGLQNGMHQDLESMGLMGFTRSQESSIGTLKGAMGPAVSPAGFRVHGFQRAAGGGGRTWRKNGIRPV